MIDKTKYNELSGGGSRMWQTKDKPLQVGDSIEGRLIEKKSEQGPKKNSMVYEIETPSGDVVGVWGGAVIDSRLKDVAIGKMVAIEFLGVEKSKTGTEYNNFYVGTGIDYVGDEN